MDANPMKERPILFSTEMVKAILAGRKTQTRRVIKPQPVMGVMSREGHEALEIVAGPHDVHGWTWKGTRLLPDFWQFMIDHNCPYGQAGDVLWVRETWNNAFWWHNLKYCYAASPETWHDSVDDVSGHKWKPSIHMPKEACRIKLLIKNIRVERLQDITEEDAKAEGVPERLLVEGTTDGSYWSYGFNCLWNEINGIDSWAANPWVWVIEFDLLK